MNIKAFYIFLLCLMSCTKSYDAINPEGYPFVGEIHQLNLNLFEKNKFGYEYPQSSKALKIIRDLKIIDNKVQCDSIVKKDCLPCNCDEVNFEMEFIYNVKNSKGNVYGGGFESRVLLNHKNKTLGIENRVTYTTGSSGLNSVYKVIYYDEWLIIPKPPIGYKFMGMLR